MELRVLLCEDNESDAKLVVRELRTAGHATKWLRVADGQALRAALAEPWDVVLSDWSMPGFSARDALGIVRRVRPELPFIIVSGTVGEEAAVEAMRAGAEDYVPKGNLSRLGPAVERELRGSAERGRHRHSEAGKRAILEAAIDGIVGIDAEGRIEEFNPAAERMHGCTRNEALGRHFLEFIAPEQRAQQEAYFRAYRERSVKKLVGKRQELVAVRKDGTRFPIELSLAELRGDGSQGFLAFVRDISDRHAAEAALRLSEARYRRLAESGIIGIGIGDLDGNTPEVNDAFLAMIGYRRDEPLPNWNDMTPPEWGEVDRRAAEQLMVSGVATPWEKELFRKDGSRVPLLVGAAVLEAPFCIFIVVDISQRKRAEAALLERMQVAALGADVGLTLTHATTLRDVLQECAEAVVRHLDAALVRIWTLDEVDKTLELQASAGLVADTDAPHGRVPVGKHEIGVIALDKRPYFANDIENDPLLDPQWAAREGFVSFAGHPLLVDGDLVGVVGIFARRPLSEVLVDGLAAVADAIALGIRRKQVEAAKTSLESQLLQAQKMEAVGSLAGGIAHDFNNLLSIILSYASLGADSLEPRDPLRADLEEILSAGKRAAELTRQLLAFSRRQVLVPQTVDLNEVVRGMEKLLRRLIGEDVELTVSPARRPALVHVDVGQMEQVIMNLAVNSRDAMPGGGKLTIEIGTVHLDEDYVSQHGGNPGGHIMLAVSDTGGGMDAATQSRIFEPFFTTKEVGKGTGLGLSTVFGIVRQSGGNIWVYSEVGHGTTFKIYLPATEDEVDQSLSWRAVEPAALRGTETILLVEDDPAVRKLTRSILRHHGYRVLEAQSGGDALLVAEQYNGTIDLVLSDVVMPRMSGPELVKRLLHMRPNLRVIYMSGYPDESIVIHDLISADAFFVQKPITPELLAAKVRRALDAPERPANTRGV